MISGPYSSSSSSSCCGGGQHSSMSSSSGGQRSSSSGGSAESVAAGCSLREWRPKSRQRRGGGGQQQASSGTSSEMEGLAVFTFGRGEDGQLGLGDTCDSDEPKFVDALRGVGVRQIACGSGHTVVLTADGEGTNNMWMTTGIIMSFSYADNSYLIIFFLPFAGVVYTWGRGDDGRLGKSGRACV